MKTVSIIMPVFNRLELVQQSIASLELPIPGVELIAVDDGSDGPTRSLLENCPGIHPIFNGRRGLAAAMNRGAEAAAGDYLVKLDSDVAVRRPNWLDVLLEADTLHPRAGILALPIQPVRERMKPQAAGKCRILVPRSNLNGACMFLKASLYRELGPFWGPRRYGYLDADYCLRAKIAGYSTGYIPGRPGEWAEHLENNRDGSPYCRWKDATRRAGKRAWRRRKLHLIAQAKLAQ